MSETTPAAGAKELTGPELEALVAAAVGKALPSALEPLTKSSGEIRDLLTRASLNAGAPSPEEIDKGLGPHPIGRKIRALGMASLAKHPGDVECAIAEVKRNWTPRYAEPTLKWLHMVKGLQVGNAVQAGDMIMPDYDPQWIEVLRPRTVIRAIASTVPMPRGATTKRKQTDSATAYYGGENDKMTDTKLKVGKVQLSYKKLTALSVLSNDLIRFGGPESDRRVQDDILAVIARREDRAFLVGNPPIDAGSPQGIRYQTNAGSNVFASAGVTLANFQADLTKAVRLVEESDVDIASGRWLISPALWWLIYSLATTTGDWIFAQQLQAGSMLGFPVSKTSQLKESRLAAWAGVASGSSGLLFFVVGGALEIHDSLQTQISIWPGGAYYDTAAGAVASGISQDETVVTCISEHDFLQTYDTAAAIITGYAY